MIDGFKETFREEAEELLTGLEGILLELETKPGDQELLNAAFRAVHTVKGSAGMFGFEAIGRFAHDLENIMDRIRSGSLPMTKGFADLALASRDHIRTMLAADDAPEPDVDARTAELVEALRAYAAQVPAPPEAEADPEKAERPEGKDAGKGSSAEETVWRLSFKPGEGVFRSGTKVLRLLEELSTLGDCACFPHTENIPELEKLDPETCRTSWDAIIASGSGPEAIKDVFIFVESESELSLDKIEEAAILQEREEPKKLGEILIERGIITKAAIDEALSSQRRLGEVLVEKKLVSKEQVESALVEQEHLKRVQERQVDTGAASIRVASDKLDQLVDLVGELVTLQARLSQTALGIQDSGLTGISEMFDRLIAQLRDNTMSIRMLPIGSTFNKFRRVVRDLSLELGKDAELATEGADTELDKTVIEKLGDPLVHIIRNSLDHGIERPADRISAGKPRSGTIRLSAMHSGAYVLIQVADDGGGLDRAAIKSKALERGIISPGADLVDQEIDQLIFAPGFSTARTVTKVSGRGVGMDVVKREIDSLGGTVLLRSERGAGTTITLKIPLTLAIIEGLLVKVADEFYVIPLSSVDGCIEIKSDEVVERDGKRIITYRGELLPFVPLRTWFDSPGEAPEISQIVIVNALESRIGFVVDQVIGDYQTVVKPLGRLYRNVRGLSGATILGDGTVALILDVNRLSQAVKRDTSGRTGRDEALHDA
ncbi:MAG: chemotaxis protein CheA [Spirochaetales bacterium]|nr:chemotaxis protein CheA [Spirochaetales bacterium]